jgi:hypothetical protein
MWKTGGDVRFALNISAAVLIITCPCALGLAVPAVVTSASGKLFRKGLLIKNGTALERLSEVDAVVFDKTGTLTMGAPRPTNLEEIPRRVLSVAMALAEASSHPLAQSLFAGAESIGVRPAILSQITEQPGYGVEAMWMGQTVRLGRASWCGATSADVTASYVQIGGSTHTIEFSDRLRPGAGQGQKAGIHQACQHLQPGGGSVAGIHHQRGQPLCPDQPRHRFGIRLGPGAARLAIAPEVGAAIGQQRHRRRHAPRPRLKAKLQRRCQPQRHRGCPAAGQGGKPPPGLHQRPGGRQQQFGRTAAKGDQRHMVAPRIGLGQQQFHSALRLGQPGQCGRAGGIEGGMSTGEVLRVRTGMKPISTVPKALATIDVASGEASKAHHQRSDVCAVPAAGIVAEAMVALVLANAVLEKFGGDSVAETKRNLDSFLASVPEVLKSFDS